MASCNMASAASGYVLSHNVSGNNTNTNSLASRINMVMYGYPTTKNINSRLVVRAAEEAVTATSVEGETTTKPKPPPIGPKRGAKVSYVM